MCQCNASGETILITLYTFRETKNRKSTKHFMYKGNNNNRTDDCLSIIHIVLFFNKNKQ